MQELSLLEPILTIIRFIYRIRVGVGLLLLFVTKRYVFKIFSKIYLTMTQTDSNSSLLKNNNSRFHKNLIFTQIFSHYSCSIRMLVFIEGEFDVILSIDKNSITMSSFPTRGTDEETIEH